MIEYVEHPVLGKMPAVRTPIAFSDIPRVPPVAPPLLGADTAAVLRELGHSPASPAAQRSGLGREEGRWDESA